MCLWIDGFSNVVVLRTPSGDHPLVCPHLVRDLADQGLWTDDTRSALLHGHGELFWECGIPYQCVIHRLLQAPYSIVLMFRTI